MTLRPFLEALATPARGGWWRLTSKVVVLVGGEGLGQVAEGQGRGRGEAEGRGRRRGSERGRGRGRGRHRVPPLCRTAVLGGAQHPHCIALCFGGVGQTNVSERCRYGTRDDFSGARVKAVQCYDAVVPGGIPCLEKSESANSGMTKRVPFLKHE